MSEMIAVKLIIARDEWQKELNRLNDTLIDERAARQVKDEVALKLADIQRKFVQTHETQLVSHAHDMVTTRELIQRILNEPMGSDVLFQFRDNLEKFLRQVSMALNQRDALFYEKEKCLKLLGEKLGPKVRLDEVISRLTGKAVNVDMEVEDKDEIIRKLKKRVDELERQSGTYADSVVEFRKQLGERDREIAKIRQMIQID